MANYVGALPSAVRSAAADSPIMVNYDNTRAAYIAVDITGTSSITVAVKGVDAMSGKAYTMLLSPILTGGTTILKIGPGLTPAANSVVNDYFPPNWQISVSGLGTYSVGVSLI